MTYPNPMPPGTIEYAGSLLGTVTPGPGFYPLNYTKFASASRQMPALVRTALDWEPQLQFHIIGRKLNDAGLYRAHWRLDAPISGPAVYPNSNLTFHPGRIDLRLRLYPDTEGMESQVNEDNGIAAFPWAGQLTGLVAALLLRRAWGGDIARTFTLTDGKQVTFTPTQLSFPVQTGSDTIRTVDIDAEPLAALAVFEAQTAPLPGGAVPGGTALWLVPPELDTSWKITYSLAAGVPDDPANRWDDAYEQVPDFVPLPAP